MKVKLVHMAKYYKPQLLSYGRVSFCRLANNMSLTHSVFLACWVSTGFFFFCAPVRKIGLPCLVAGDAIWYEWGLCDHRIASLVKRWNYYCTIECRSFATATWLSDRHLERAVVAGMVSPPLLSCASAKKSICFANIWAIQECISSYLFYYYLGYFLCFYYIYP